MKAIVTLCLMILAQSAIAQVYDDYIGVGQYEGVTVTSSDQTFDGMQSLDASGIDLDLQGTSRFLASATLGADLSEVQRAEEIGIEAWIDDQMQMPFYSLTEPTIEIVLEMLANCMLMFGDDCLPMFQVNTVHWRYAWWHHTMTSDDMLRQRLAMALSELLVISDQSDLTNYPHGMANYYDILRRNAFGNYRDILMEVTLHPVMGFYLSHLNNPLSIPALNIHPDENYAREIMQLFSIGLYELNLDGSRKIDSITGLWIPTYDNEDIQGLAKVFTGLSGGAWSDPGNLLPVEFGRNLRAYSVTTPMQMFEQWHEKGDKHIVGDFTIPDGQSGMEDVEMAVEHLFNHPNVGPFLSRQLIQRMVKSNPTPEYIGRVAAVFNDNGQGVRGDMAAVVKAILLDVEALDCYWKDDAYNGTLREPIVRLTQLLHGLQAETQSEWYWNSGVYFQTFTEQHPLSSPTVFNFFTPEYVPNQDFAYANLVGPEFQILNSATSSNYVNFILIGLMREYLNDRFAIDLPFVLNEPQLIPYVLDQRPYAARLTDELWMELAFAPSELVDYLDLILANGHLSDTAKESIVNSMEQFQDPVNAAYYAAFLIMIHPDYIIKK